MNNETAQADINTLLLSRSRFFRAVRSYFTARDFLEVDTPVLAPFCIPEPSMELFETRKLAMQVSKENLFLVPSPEIWMKRLLAMGIGDQYQISKCFRNNEVPGPIHLPEFTMLEWYAVNKNYSDNIRFTEDLVLSVLGDMGLPEIINFQGTRIDFSAPWYTMNMQEACIKYAGIDLSLIEKCDDFFDVLDKKNMEYSPEDSWEELFHRIFLLEVEPVLPKDKPLFLTNYPKNIRTLAKETGGFAAERWELYIGGIEIANCYSEMKNPEQIGRYFNDEAARQKKQCTVIPPSDNELQNLLQTHEFPDCSGVALGIDRLLMILLNKKHIKQVVPFSSYL